MAGIHTILYSDATGQGGMDKNIGEQLNRAYEAFRQACMDRDSAVRELQQKTETYEQRIREQQEQLSSQQTLINNLKSQLLKDSCRDNSYGYLLEDSERRKNNLTLDEPHDKVKLGTLRNKQSKVRRQEVSSGKEPSKDLSLPVHHERDNIEKTFWDLKEEFHRICLLAKAQKDHLSKLNIPDIATDTQCSVPVQCTDKTEKQEALFKPQAKDATNRGTSCIVSVVTPRGLGRDEEDTSLESLSKFNVKFPPMDNDSTFLHSTPETPNIHTPATSEAVCQGKFNMEVRDNPGNFGKTEETLFEIRGIDPITSTIQNLKITDKTKPSNLRAPCLPAGDHNMFYVNTFPLQDPPDAPLPSLDSPGKAVRGPQQPIWKPFLNQDSDLVVLTGADSECLKAQVCEFCQKLFPPSITSREDFLRHLNSHFNGET
ncbi:TRAF family member-associated NF-kappa-B activator isoform X1 [Phodopus roborovskii]|uniref:TRAF family member-associated NF-kappa-B activator isoform X1 n=2 Tax=Phodopus roborovskii TaxID=109678 RepID=UPI0021E4D5E3|nr:TRAF family member-associated NF-kappa-B activator isoform X1 [Phodopus roborovskii]